MGSQVLQVLRKLGASVRLPLRHLRRLFRQPRQPSGPSRPHLRAIVGSGPTASTLVILTGSCGPSGALEPLPTYKYIRGDGEDGKLRSLKE